jgi:hypothetical protein
MEEDVTMEALSERTAPEPAFGVLISRGRQLWEELARRPWRQAPISLARALVRPLPDRTYLALAHLCYFGSWPDYDYPRTFNEHIHEYMLRCRDPLLKVATDKVLCRSYITAHVGSSYLVPLLGVWDDADAVPLETLQRPCVLKPSAASGLTLMLRAGDDRRPAQLRRVLRGWLRRDYSRLHREWCYVGLPRRIIAETMLIDATSGGVPPDYKAYVIGGAVRFFQVDRARFSTHHTRNLYGPRWETFPARWTLENHALDPAPPCLAEMVTVAEELARPFEFLRVDYYVVDGHLYIGELTSYPGAGFEKFIPASYAHVMGAYWKRPGR